MKIYRDYIRFNINLIIAAFAGFIRSSFVSQIYFLYYGNRAANSLVGLIGEYTFYPPVFAYLFYRSNRQRYIDSNGAKDYRRIRTDILKLFTTFSLSEVVFAISRSGFQYFGLQAGLEAYQASMIGSSTAWFIFFLLVNIGTKAVRLFR